jgi:hypothetical protein
MLYVAYDFEAKECHGSGWAVLNIVAPRNIKEIEAIIEMIKEINPDNEGVIPINWKELGD